MTEATVNNSFSGSHNPPALHKNEFLPSARGSRIVLPDERGVLSYLEQHPDLFDRLPAILSEARKEFEDAELSLEEYADPETDDRSLTLFVRQQPGGPPLLRQIDSFCDRHEMVLQDLLGSFLITTDFRSPRSNNAL